MWTSWLFLVLLSVCAYSIVVGALKERQLDSSLRVAIYTVNQSIQAGDWPLALGHLQALEHAGPVFDITLRSSNASQNTSGPFGENPVGLGTLCSEQTNDQQWILRGCMRVLGWTELYTLVLFVIFSLLLLSISFWLFRSRTLLFIGQITDELAEMQRAGPSSPRNEFIVEIDAIRKHINGLRQQTEQMSRDKALVEISAQVAHDIRSPLAALNMVAEQADAIPEEDRLIVRSAVGSINDIVNNLDVTNRASGVEPLERAVEGEERAQLLSSAVSSVTSQKRVQFRDRPEVEIVLKMSNESYGLFCHMDAKRFKRVLSNLVSNAVESIEKSGKVEVALKTEAEKAVVVVSDTGKGIPIGILPKIGTRGFSYGKANGKGLGLHSSKEIIESWGGRLAISTSGAGTNVSLELCIAKPPSWYVPIVLIPANSKVVVLDDDQSVHHVWKRRFSEAGTEEKGIDVVHFSSAQQLEGWVQENGSNRTLFLVDYELIRQGKTGLDVIEALGIAAKSILVTSRYEEAIVLDRCKEQGVRIIPKTLASIVPLRIEVADDTGKTEYVLIDDSEAIHLLWGSAARRANLVLHGFQTAGKFFEDIDQFCSFETVIYIDSDLGTPEPGEQVARRIRELGFENIYLTTGHDPRSFRGMWWLSGIVGKEPPWEAPVT